MTIFLILLLVFIGGFAIGRITANEDGPSVKKGCVNDRPKTFPNLKPPVGQGGREHIEPPRPWPRPKKELSFKNW